ALDCCLPSGAVGQRQFRLIERSTNASRRHDDWHKERTTYREWVDHDSIVQNLEDPPTRGTRIEDGQSVGTRSQSQSMNVPVAESIGKANPACTAVAALEHTVACESRI